MDNGCQPTSRAYLETLDILGITGEWVGFNCPEQNAHVESVIGTFNHYRLKAGRFLFRLKVGSSV
jgi:transposase InsO family protein